MSRNVVRRVVAILCIAFPLVAPSPAMAQTARTQYSRGLGWLGRAASCIAPAGWSASRLFHLGGLRPDLAQLCLYRWTGALGPLPSAAQLAALATTSQATELTEDVPVVYPSAPWSGAETAVLAGLRAALRAQVGDVSLAPKLAADRKVRIAVLDTAPDAPHGQVHPGASRHGDTLVHLIEDLVCLPGGGCAAEVTSVLAMPWLDRTTYAATGGYLGTLADLARAVERAVETWQLDRGRDPSAPSRLVLNLSLGWEHTAQIADCAASTSPHVGPPARAVRGILQYAAAQGALIVAAAGNDAGGPHPREGLVCPGRFQEIAQDADPARALLVAVSGVDYHDRALATVRPHGTTAIVGLGLGGVAWNPIDPAPPALTGSSVSTAVVSAIGALTWAARPDWSAAEVTKAVYDGGVALSAQADACPGSFASCVQRRASTCGALEIAGLGLGCTPPAARPGSRPALPVEMAALGASFAGVAAHEATVASPPYELPRYVAPSVQLEPSTFPMPISETCPTCAVSLMQSGPTALLPARSQPLLAPMLVLQLANGDQRALQLGTALESEIRYVFSLPEMGSIQTVYLTGFELSGNSLTEQILVAP